MRHALRHSTSQPCGNALVNLTNDETPTNATRLSTNFPLHRNNFVVYFRVKEQRTQRPRTQICNARYEVWLQRPRPKNRHFVTLPRTSSVNELLRLNSPSQDRDFLPSASLDFSAQHFVQTINLPISQM